MLPTLALLIRQPALIAVTVQVTVADAVYEVTVSKAIDAAGAVLCEYWWEVDRLTADEQGQACRQKCWQLGHRVYETAEAAYVAAVAWVRSKTVPAPGGPPRHGRA